jgi:hypothetical protein
MNREDSRRRAERDGGLEGGSGSGTKKEMSVFGRDIVCFGDVAAAMLKEGSEGRVDDKARHPAALGHRRNKTVIHG